MWARDGPGDLGTNPHLLEDSPAARSRRPHPSCVRLRPNCQRATSKMRGCPNESAACRSIANQKVRGSGRCGLHGLRGRHGREVASIRTPSPPRSLQPRIRLRVKRSSPPECIQHQAIGRPSQAVFRPLHIFYALPQCPVGELRRMKSKYRLGCNGRLGGLSLSAPTRPFHPSLREGSLSRDARRAPTGWHHTRLTGPGKMSFDFSAARAGADGEPGVQIDEGLPGRLRASRSRPDSRQRPALPWRSSPGDHIV